MHCLQRAVWRMAPRAVASDDGSSRDRTGAAHSARPLRTFIGACIVLGAASDS